jgi:alpha-L-arabinofuranosidase
LIQNGNFSSQRLHEFAEPKPEGESMVKYVFAANLTVMLLPLCAAAQTGTSPNRKVAVTIDAGKTSPPISPYIYGQFIEHIGDLINRSLWAEMLDDRKFYNDISSKPVLNAGRRGRVPNVWRPIGPDESVGMDRHNPYVGEHTPLVQLAGGTPRGIEQGGLPLRKGKAYTGRLVLAGAPGARISVSIVWGAGPGDRQTIPITGLDASYARFPLKFMAAVDTDDGRIEISGTGQGSFHIGAASLMPADNTKGFRPDTVGLLKQQRSGMYRFPGGNFLSAHEWRDAIGDPDRRPPRWDPVWSAVQPNDVGTDEFMTLMGLLGVDPYINVNAGFGDEWSAAELVEYANGAETTPMGRLRAANGHPEPYHVKWWGIGNEMYGAWQFGHMALNQYVFKHNRFGEAMRKADPSITLTATGATPDEMTIYGLALPIVGKLIPDFGSAGDWDYGLFTHCFDYIDIMSEHFYSYAGQRFDHSSGIKPGAFNRAGYMVKVDEPLVEWARRPANRVRNKVEAYNEYLERIPALKTRRIPMAIDEWAYTGGGNNLKGSLANAMVLQEMFRHTDLIKMAAHTMGLSAIDYTATNAALNTTGLLFRLYRDHFGTVPVQVDGNSPVPAPLYPAGADQPRVNAGSPTYPVDVSAAMTADGKFLTVAIVNPTESMQAVEWSAKGIVLRGRGRLWLMTGPSLTAAAGLNQQEVQIRESVIDGRPNALAIPPISIAIYDFERQ